ncbi:MAG: PorV/PorQ family protein [Rhodothermales bacterium]|nr:PorV/PorQ family protein [Rhodothermales bacterium]
MSHPAPKTVSGLRVLAALVAALPAIWLAGWTGTADAQHAGAFARVGFGARGISMGNAVAADVYSGESPWYNPALAPLVRGQHLDATVSSMSFDRSLQFLEIGAPLQDRAGVAAGVIHASVSDIDGRDNSGFHTGDLSVDEYAGFLAFGLRFSDRFTGGVSLQLFRTDLFDGLTPARSVGLDVGFAYRVSDTWSASFVLDDLLARYSWDSSDISSGGRSVTDSFPRRLRLGVATRQFDKALLVGLEVESRFISVDASRRSVRILGDAPAEVSDTEDLTLQETRLRAGAEYVFMESFALRAGVEQLGPEALGTVRPSVGFMVEQRVGELVLRAEYGLALEAAAGGRMHLLTVKLFL